MNIPDGCYLAYVVSHEAWYSSATPNDPRCLTVEAAARDDVDGVAWSFQVSEHRLGREDFTRIEMFNDAYEAFAQVPEFFALMREHQPGTLREVRGILDGLGAADLTQRTQDGAPGEAGRKVVRGQVVTGRALGRGQR